MVKALGFERGGYFNWSKRLEQGPFAPAVSAGGAAVALSATEMTALLGLGSPFPADLGGPILRRS